MGNAISVPDVTTMQRNAARAETMLKLLANAKRLMVLCHLVGGAKAVGELVACVGLSQSALSQHLARMREQGLVKAERRGQSMLYSIANPEVEAILSTLYRLYCQTPRSGARNGSTTSSTSRRKNHAHSDH